MASKVSEIIEVTPKDQLELLLIKSKSIDDPIWFIRNVLEFNLYPAQEEAIRQFYRHKYDTDQPEYKKMVLQAGQRCLSHSSLIKTQNGIKKISDLYDHNLPLIEQTPIPLHGINVFNGKDWVEATDIFYTGKKIVYLLELDNGYSIKCSKEHKFKSKDDEWKELRQFTIGEPIVIDNGLSSIKSITKLKKLEDTYDLHVPNGNCYVANGILTHNSGKTAVASTILAYELFCLLMLDNPSKHYGLAPGAIIALTCVAVSKDQANYGVFANMINMVKKNPFFQKHFPNLLYHDQKIEDPDRQILCQVLAANVATAAGYTNKCVIFDELDLFQRSMDSRIGADLVYTKLTNSTQTFGDQGKIVAISSLQYVDGIMNRIYKDGLEEPQTLALSYCTWEMNPTITEEQLRNEYKYNMVAFFRDFANRPDISSGLQFPEGIKLNRSLVNVLNNDYVVKPHEPYRVMAIDPAYKNDAFAVAVGYRKGNHIIIDGVRRFTKMDDADAIIRPSDIRIFIENNIRKLHVINFVHDVYMYPEIIESMKYKFGIQPIQHHTLNEDYNRWREYQDRELDGIYVDVIYDEHLEREARGLLVQRQASGKVRTDHPYGGGKDTADAVCNCIWFLATNGEMEFQYVPIGHVIVL